MGDERRPGRAWLAVEEDLKVRQFDEARDSLDDAFVVVDQERARAHHLSDGQRRLLEYFTGRQASIYQRPRLREGLAEAKDTGDWHGELRLLLDQLDAEEVSDGEQEMTTAGRPQILPVCPACGGLVGDTTTTHFNDCPNDHRGFVAIWVPFVPKSRLESLEQRVAVAEHERDDAVENWKLDSASLRVAEQRAEIAWKYGLDYKRWCEEADQRAAKAEGYEPWDGKKNAIHLFHQERERAAETEQRLQKAKEALWKIGDADYGYTERPHWKLSHEHLYVGDDEASAYARAVLAELGVQDAS